MEEKSTYVDILVMALKKKITILEQMDRDALEQEALLKKQDVSMEEIESTEERKRISLEELEKADMGFERVYERVKDAFEENRYLYEVEIKEMQQLIKKITNYTAKIQAQELRNKQLMEYYFQRKKNEVKAFQFNQQSANKYTSHLADRESGVSYFFDNKK